MTAGSSPGAGTGSGGKVKQSSTPFKPVIGALKPLFVNSPRALDERTRGNVTGENYVYRIILCSLSSLNIPGTEGVLLSQMWYMYIHVYMYVHIIGMCPERLYVESLWSDTSELRKPWLSKKTPCYISPNTIISAHFVMCT